MKGSEFIGLMLITIAAGISFGLWQINVFSGIWMFCSCQLIVHTAKSVVYLMKQNK